MSLVDFRVTLLCTLFLFTFQVSAQSKDDVSLETNVIFDGKVVEVGPSPRSASGGVEVYQLAKYKIRRIINDEFKEKYVVVDHLLLDGDELSKITVGQRVCVSFRKSPTIERRYDDEVLRRYSDQPVAFFIGFVHKTLSESPCRR